jgi:hypothetical protein
LTINNVAVEYTTQGTNKGAGQLSSRAIFQLKKNDVITIRNHSSMLGPITLSDHAGGMNAANSVILTVFKIAQVCKPTYKEVPHHIAKKLECLYKPFRNYLLEKEELQVAGSNNYLSIVNGAVQTVPQNGPFYFATKVLANNLWYKPGETYFEIKKSGIYDIFADIATNEPLQLVVSVNGCQLPHTLFGRDSGANRTNIRQFVHFKCGDKVSILNVAASPNITTAENSGGSSPGNNATFMMFMLRPWCE